MNFIHNYLCALNQCSSFIIIFVHWVNVAKCDIFEDFQTRWRSSSLGKFPLFSIVTFSTFALAESFIGVALEFAEASQIEWQSPAKNWTMKYLGFLPFSSLKYSILQPLTNQHARKDAFCFCGRNFHFLLRAIFPAIGKLRIEEGVNFLVLFSVLKANVNSSCKCYIKYVDTSAFLISERHLYFLKAKCWKCQNNWNVTFWAIFKQSEECSMSKRYFFSLMHA